MNDRQLSKREAEDTFESVDSDEELLEYLDELAPHIGWVVIYFNSLEDTVSQCVREAVLRDPDQDERIDVFLSEMLFAAKCRSLIHLYGQLIESGAVKFTQTDLSDLEKLLLECAKRRNEYAHGDWIGVRKGNYVQVKTQTKKIGITHRYKKFELAQVEADVSFIAEARHYLDDFNEKLTDQL